MDLLICGFVLSGASFIAFCVLSWIDAQVKLKGAETAKIVAESQKAAAEAQRIAAETAAAQQAQASQTGANGGPQAAPAGQIAAEAIGPADLSVVKDVIAGIGDVFTKAGAALSSLLASLIFFGIVAFAPTQQPKQTVACNIPAGTKLPAAGATLPAEVPIKCELSGLVSAKTANCRIPAGTSLPAGGAASTSDILLKCELADATPPAK